MKFKSFIAAAALALSSLGAFASVTFSNGLASFNSGSLAAGGFTQTIDFSGLAAGTYDIFGTLSGNSLTFSSVTLDGNAWDITNLSSLKGKQYSFGTIEVTASRPLTLTFIGTAYGSTGSYSGDLTVTAVPEPETYSMLLAGLGLMGAIARRRNKASAA